MKASNAWNQKPGSKFLASGSGFISKFRSHNYRQLANSDDVDHFEDAGEQVEIKEHLVSANDDELDDVELRGETIHLKLRHSTLASKTRDDDDRLKTSVFRDEMTECLTEFILYDIKPLDTLQSLSLTAGCSMSHMKRCNNLMNDQDFHALRTIRIPVKKFGLISEVLTKQINASNGHSGQNGNEMSVVNVGFGNNISTEIDVTDEFLSQMDKDLEQIRDATKYYKDSLDDVVKTLNEPIINITSRRATNAYSCDGADCGLNWYSLIVLVIVLCILLPVIYAFVINVEVNKHYNNHSFINH